jgi:hypothetical protein
MLYPLVNSNGKSPVKQDFIWVAEYPDGTHLSEFDFITKEENSFYKIDRKRVFRFGLLGHGARMFFERDGVFDIAGRRIFISYLHEGKEIPLNGDFRYNVNDIITYKDAESSGLIAGYKGQGRLFNTITQYNFGYKVNLNVDGINFHFKPIVKIPLNMPVMLHIWLVADKELNGKFIIRSNGRVAFESLAPLKPNVGGELHWVIQ